MLRFHTLPSLTADVYADESDYDSLENNAVLRHTRNDSGQAFSTDMNRR